MLSLIYKDKEYSWEEWVQEYESFVENLELPTDLEVNPGYRDMLIIHDKGYSIAADKFIDLFHLIASARFGLINAFQKFYDSNIISSENSYEAHLWMRSEYVKNSIIWYNSCEDYIYQILWFGFNMHGCPMNEANWYQDALKSCTYPRVKTKLEDYDSSNPSASQLLTMINDYRFDDDVKFLRDELANNLKHRGNLRFHGLENARIIGHQEVNNEGDIIFDSSWIEPLVIDIDSTVNLLANVHEKLVSYAREILDYMDIYNVFKEDEDGNYRLNVIKSKDRYKKLIF